MLIGLSAIVFCMAGSSAAYSQLGVQLNVGAPAVYAPPPPAYVAPAPVYVSPYPTYYDPWHRHHDYAYWRAHRHHR